MESIKNYEIDSLELEFFFFFWKNNISIISIISTIQGPLKIKKIISLKKLILFFLKTKQTNEHKFFGLVLKSRK